MIVPNIWEVIKHVPNHQPDILLFQLLTIINHRLTIDSPGKLYGSSHHQPALLWHPLGHVSSMNLYGIPGEQRFFWDFHPGMCPTVFAERDQQQAHPSWCHMGMDQYLLIPFLGG